MGRLYDSTIYSKLAGITLGILLGLLLAMFFISMGFIFLFAI